jgi:hypothetical protein
MPHVSYSSILQLQFFQMDRRSLLKTCIAISAGAFLLPSCLDDKTKSSILLKNIQVSGEQEKMLAELTETIIPKTDTPGAKDVSAHLFALMMVDDCYSKEDQQKFIAGMNQFEAEAKKRFDNPFVKCQPAQRQAFLADIEAKKDVAAELQDFYNITKRLTIKSFTQSQFFLSKVEVYMLVPGSYQGCVKVA